MMHKQHTYKSLHKPSKHIVGGGNVGYLTCSYKHLVDMFGEPTIKTDGYKTSAEWHVEHVYDQQFQGVTAIYDYKQCKTYCGESGLETEQITQWNLGGKSQKLASDLINFVSNPKTLEQACSNC